jgi:hypothetical protein
MTILTVGPGKQYATLSAAIAGSHNGDTLQVQAGTYNNDFATINTNISLVGVGGMVHLVATKAVPNGKAILVTNSNVNLTNFEFSGAKVADGNGAGIRYQAGNLTINKCYFHDNQEGLLAANSPSGTIAINNSEFSHNGVGTPGAAGYGSTHNLYVGQVGTLKITSSYFHDAVVGHEIKSRANNTTIQNSRIQDNSNGTASYSIDLPNGGKAAIQNNVIEQGPHSQNPVIIAFGEEGSLRTTTSLQVSGNTILNDLNSSSSLAVWNKTAAVAQITSNEFFGLAAAKVASGPNAQSNNTFLHSEPALDTSHPWVAVPQVATTLTNKATNNAFESGLGVEAIAGTAANNPHVVDHASDKMSEAASRGTEAVPNSVSFAHGTNVENLTLTSAAHIDHSGNTLVNFIVDNDGAHFRSGDVRDNALVSGAGHDVLPGGSGDDNFEVKNVHSSAVRINDVEKGMTDGVLDISNILHDLNPHTRVLNDSVHSTQRVSNAAIPVNAGGVGHDLVNAAVLLGFASHTANHVVANDDGAHQSVI